MLKIKKSKKTSFERRLKAYSVAAIGTLALAPSANAAIQYSGIQNIVVDSGNPFVSIDMDGNGSDDFGFGYSSFATTARGHIIFGATTGNSIIDENYPPLVVNLPANYTVDSTLATGRIWLSGGYLDAIYLGNPYGQFLNRRGYIGVRFNAQCGTAYGWIQYQANADATSGTIIDWAYEDTCQPIRAGATGAPTQPVSVPTLNEWGMIAGAGLLGAAAYRALRKREQEG